MSPGLINRGEGRERRFVSSIRKRSTKQKKKKQVRTEGRKGDKGY